MAEWSIAPVLKTGNGQPFVSSNLTASARWALSTADPQCRMEAPDGVRATDMSLGVRQVPMSPVLGKAFHPPAGAADGGNADGRPGVAVGEGFGAFRPFRPEAFAAWAVLIRRGRRGRSQIRQAVRVL